MSSKSRILFGKSVPDLAPGGDCLSGVVPANGLGSVAVAGGESPPEMLIFVPATGVARNLAFGRLSCGPEAAAAAMGALMPLLTNLCVPPDDAEQELKTLLDSLWTPFD
jgi:hypothetical protein